MEQAFANPSLRNLQKWMRWIITDPRGVLIALKEPAPEDVDHLGRYRPSAPSALGSIVGDPSLSPEDRLSIYAEAYFTRIVEALSTNFLTVRRVLGEEAFLGVVARFLKSHPSRVPNIDAVGAQLPSFLETDETEIGFPFLSDLARVEWAVIESFYARDLPQLSTDALADISAEYWPKAKFDLDPSVQLLKTHWPVNQLWDARGKERLDEMKTGLKPGNTNLLIYRKNGFVSVQSIYSGECAILKSLGAGECLETLCEELAGRVDALPPLMDWFHSWVQAGVIRGVSFR